ncbi:MAG: hypothetical protein GF317_15135 [Candidatus Lokiarchaeota archaeon]|nr:hypothetical protein [Candidatus Lokiarchaeota archaeon]MBD3200908.1 hypothetical protein [Candidatus Lokiarchaeota archaeon]
MDIKISKKELIEYTKLKLLSEITLTKEKLNLFENKYDRTLEEFRTKIEKTEEQFEEWDDYIEWKAYFKRLQDLKKKLNELDNAKDIKIV